MNALPAHVAAMWRGSAAARKELEAVPSVIDGLRLRRIMHAGTGIDFQRPRRYFTGWYMDSTVAVQTAGRPKAMTRIIVSVAPYGDAEVPEATQDAPMWVHASMHHHHRVPTYDELSVLHTAVYGDGWAYTVFAPPDEHVNIHEHVLHLWGRLDGSRVLPNFGFAGTI